MKSKHYLPALILALSFFLVACQSTAGSGAVASVAASSGAAASSTASSNFAASTATPLTITEEFIHPDTVARIENLSDHIKDFIYNDMKADSLEAAWTALMDRSEISGYPIGMLEYAEYSLYQNYLNMATYYGTDLDTMLKERMNTTHDEMVAEIQKEANIYMGSGMVARYILDKENVVTPEILAEMSQYTLTEGASENTSSSITSDGSQSAASSEVLPSALTITTEQALALANGWIMDNLVEHPIKEVII